MEHQFFFRKDTLQIDAVYRNCKTNSTKYKDTSVYTEVNVINPSYEVTRDHKVVLDAGGIVIDTEPNVNPIQPSVSMPMSQIDEEKLKVQLEKGFRILQPLFLKKHPLIDSLDQQIRAIFNEKKPSLVYKKIDNKEDFKKRFWLCIRKMQALWYHFNNILILEGEYINKITEFHKVVPYTGGYEAFSPEKMEFEFEAFLLQSKACLDVFSRSFKPYLKNESSNTKKLKKELEKHVTDQTCQKILNELKKAKWLEEFELKEPWTYRDIIAHRGKISISPINIYPNGKKVIFVPSLMLKRLTKNKIPVKEYAEEMMNNIFTLIFNCYPYLLYN